MPRRGSTSAEMSPFRKLEVRSSRLEVGDGLQAVPANLIVKQNLAVRTIVCVASISALAMQTTQPAQPPTFRAEANLVRVDVTVVDRHGEPVAALTADDFAVEEDGIPQTIQSFKFVSADGQPPPGDDVSLPIRSREHAAAEAARDDVRVFVIFWDEYHIGRFAEAIKGRKALSEFVSSSFGPADLVALMDPLLPVDALKFTRDRRELSEKIARLEGRYGIYMPTRSAAEDNMLERRDIGRVRSEVTISALKSAAVHLGSIKEGRKSIIFMSEGLSGLGVDQLSLIRELTETANDNNTAIYTVDPGGLTGGSSDVLRTIAESTGAEAFVNTNSAGAWAAPGGQGSQRLLPARLLVGSQPAGRQVPQDRREGEAIGNRRACATRLLGAERNRARESARRSRRGRRHSGRRDQRDGGALVGACRADVDVWAGVERGADGQPAVTVAWTPRPAAGRPDPARTVSVAVKGAGGDQLFEASLERRCAVVSVAARRRATRAHGAGRDRQCPRRRSQTTDGAGFGRFRTHARRAAPASRANRSRGASAGGRTAGTRLRRARVRPIGPAVRTGFGVWRVGSRGRVVRHTHHESRCRASRTAGHAHGGRRREISDRTATRIDSARRLPAGRSRRARRGADQDARPAPRPLFLISNFQLPPSNF